MIYTMGKQMCCYLFEKDDNRLSVRKIIPEHSGIYFLTITCRGWHPLFELTEGYNVVYRWFDHLKSQGHHIAGYVIMPNHLHALIAFRHTDKTINSIIGNGKRFMAYDLVKRLVETNHRNLLLELATSVVAAERKKVSCTMFSSHRSTGRSVIPTSLLNRN